MTVQSPVDELIERLAVHETDADAVLSCYVRLDAEARQRRLYLAKVKARVKELEAELPTRGLDRQTGIEVRRDLARIVEWFGKPGNLANRPGVGLFVSERLGLFEAITVPRVFRTRLDLGRRPALEPLIGARERLDTQLALVVDRERARFFEIRPDGADEIEGVLTPTRRGGRFHSDRGDAPGWGERRYHNRMASQRHRHYAEVAEEAGRLYDRMGARGVAVMGPSVHAKALVDFLPDRLRSALLGVGRLTPSAATPAEVADLTWQLHAERERIDEARLVGEVDSLLEAGRATNGLRETVRALGRGQVRTLVVPVAGSATGFRCVTTGRLVLQSRECAAEGGALPEPNLIDAAVDEALRQGADVRVIDDPDLAARLDVLAATLRFGD
ncbi:MAG: hypothetical protein R2909_19700 [Gemmatimonadales bacterium]